MKVIFTDLDGTLLHARTYSYSAAMPALEMVRQRGVPLVFCTSKTRAEVEFWREETGNRHPFIVENGGAIYAPIGYFDLTLPQSRLRGGYEVIELGTPYRVLVDALEAAAEEADCPVEAFSTMSAVEIVRRTQLPLQQARWAQQREYDEAFEILGNGDARLVEAIERRGRRCIQGTCSWHITGGHNKSFAVRILSAIYRAAFGRLVTVGLGDGPNDVSWLSSVDIPVVVGSAVAEQIHSAVPHSRLTRARGPRGWSEAILELLAA